MRRRDVIAGLVVAATMARAKAQQGGKVYRIAIVSPSTPVVEMTEAGEQRYRTLFRELRRLGYVEGQNLAVQRFSGGGLTDRYPDLAREVVQRDPDLIVVSSSRLVLNFKAATATIPIVGLTADPVVAGIVSNLARPGANITGVSADAGFEVWGKRLELLRDVSPGISRVGYLASRAVWESQYGAAVRSAAETLGVSLFGPPIEGSIDSTEYRRVFAAMAKERVDAVLARDVHDEIRPHR